MGNRLLGGYEVQPSLRDVDGCVSLDAVLERLLKTPSQPLDWLGQLRQINASIGSCLGPMGNAILLSDQLLLHADHAVVAVHCTCMVRPTMDG